MIPVWATKLPLNLIFEKAKEFSLDPMLIAAIVNQESRGYVYAVRFEGQWKNFHRAEHFAKYHRITLETEQQLQMFSYGLVQIMGATARWLGFEGALPALFKPENNLYWGAKYLADLSKKYAGINDVIASYNAGSPIKDGEKYRNQGYVDSVLKFYNELTKAE